MQEPLYLSNLALVAIWFRMALTQISIYMCSRFFPLDIPIKHQYLTDTTILISTGRLFDTVLGVDDYSYPCIRLYTKTNTGHEDPKKRRWSPRRTGVTRVFVCKPSVVTSSRTMTLDVKLLHPLQGVDTTSVANIHGDCYVTTRLRVRNHDTSFFAFAYSRIRFAVRCAILRRVCFWIMIAAATRFRIHASASSYGPGTRA